MQQQFLTKFNQSGLNAQLKPGDNVQIGADNEYIVGVDIFSDRNDVWTLVPFF